MNPSIIQYHQTRKFIPAKHDDSSLMRDVTPSIASTPYHGNSSQICMNLLKTFFNFLLSGKWTDENYTSDALKEA
jgi:hypothetical protein